MSVRSQQTVMRTPLQQGLAKTAFLVTCEHATNAVPPEVAPAFSDAEALLDSHRGYDPGADSLSRTLAQALDAPLVTGTVSRLVLDLNRSVHNRALFSQMMFSVPPALKATLLQQYYEPYRSRVRALVAERIDAQLRVLHLSVHSFTPTLAGIRRTADIGILYDPQRPTERTFANRLAETLHTRLDGWRIRRNYPYRGKSDGVTSWLRQEFEDVAYCGIELEINQACLTRDIRTRPGWQEQLVEGIREAR